jgi:cytochrome c oxidase cbb3-type subunit 1
MGSTGSAHPPINPETGGTTGTSVFGSTLGTAFLFCALPLLLGVRPKEPGSARHRRVLLQTLAVFVVAILAFALLDKGDVSRRDPSQYVALGSLLLWPPVVGRWLARFAWPRASRPWLWASAAWGSLLVSTGLLTYLPGILQRWKFTNALVGHAHLAMAGLLTALCILIWTVLAPEKESGGMGAVFGDSRSFQLWNGGCALMILALAVLGTVEALDPTVVHRSHPVADSLYGLRLLAGLAMTAASVRWWHRSLACLGTAEAVSAAGSSPASSLSLRTAPETGS